MAGLTVGPQIHRKILDGNLAKRSDRVSSIEYSGLSSGSVATKISESHLIITLSFLSR